MSWVGRGKQPCYLAHFRVSSASRREAIPHDKAVRNWPSVNSVKRASKSTANHYFSVFLRCSLALGLKHFWRAARLVQRAVHGDEQWQIAQLRTAVNVALRKDIAAHHHFFRLTSKALILASPELHTQVASYEMMDGLGDEKI